MIDPGYRCRELKDEAAARPAGDALHAAGVSFIKTGRPETPGQPAWPAYQATIKASMIIDNRCELAHALDAPFEAVW